MSLPTEQRINMSLDDLIKSSRQTKKPASAGAGKKKVTPVGRKPRVAIAKATNKPKQQPNNNNNKNVKVAKSVGAGKAKRNANINKLRGINNSGKATKQDIAKEVNKQLNKKAPVLKISFKPSELNKTTERVVTQQIKAVLGRQSNKPTSAGSVGNNSKGSSNNSSPRGRRNPKANTKKVLIVKH